MDNKNSTQHSPIIEAQAFDIPSAQKNTLAFKLTPVHFVLFALALLCLAFIGFVSLSKSIQVSAVTPDLTNLEKRQPVDASIKLETKLKLPIGNRVLLLPGKHKVSMSAAGFHPVQQTLTVAGDRHQQFELEMARLPGSIKVELPSGITANAIIDGEVVGQLPGILENIEAGEREITIDADLYRPFNTTMLVQGMDKQQSLSVELIPAWAEYSFTTSPAGADIVVDGRVLGTTPAVVKIEEGSRSLSLQADRFKSYARELSVVAQESIEVPEITLIPADGILNLASNPVGAAVILNDEFRGITPLSLTLKPDQQQSLKIYKAGYQLQQQNVSLQAAETRETNVDLAADIISVRVSVVPEDAQVYVDGVARGRGSQTLSLTSLPHSVSVRKAGYVTQNNEIVPTRNSKQVLSFRLLTEEQHYWAQVPAQYTNRLGHEMKLFKNLGRVEMGSSRREDGRRANETRYQAELTKPFYVSLHETTNKQFRQFKATHNGGNYKGKSLDANRAPAFNVSWQQAAQYCNWLSKVEGLDPFYQTVKGFVSGVNPGANGYRLLTEAEWSWLARSSDKGLLTYPWGNSKTFPRNQKIENFADQNASKILAFTLNGYQDGYIGPAPVGRFPANHRGLYDMGGNAAEWVNDWYSAKGSSELSSSGLVRDPLGPDNGEFHVVRGASWARGHLPQLRLAYRDYGAKGSHDIGFRVARYAGLNKKSSRQIAQK